MLLANSNTILHLHTCNEFNDCKSSNEGVVSGSNVNSWNSGLQAAQSDAIDCCAFCITSSSHHRSCANSCALFVLFFHSDQMQELKAEGIEVDTQRASDAALDDLMAHGGYSALIVRSANTVRESTIRPGLKVIGRAGAGNRSIT
jgi:hypothetical protein